MPCERGPQKHTSMSQMVQVVSMLDVPSRFGSVSFQSKDVNGAQNSLFLFCTAACKAVKSHINTPAGGHPEEGSARLAHKKMPLSGCSTGHMDDACLHAAAQASNRTRSLS